MKRPASACRKSRNFPRTDDQSTALLVNDSNSDMDITHQSTQEITCDMLRTAVAKAIEAGLFPRHAPRSDLARNEEIMFGILKAALQLSRSQQATRMAE